MSKIRLYMLIFLILTLVVMLLGFYLNLGKMAIYPILLVQFFIYIKIIFMKCEFCGKRLLGNPFSIKESENFLNIVLIKDKCFHCGKSQKPTKKHKP